MLGEVRSLEPYQCVLPVTLEVPHADSYTLEVTVPTIEGLTTDAGSNLGEEVGAATFSREDADGLVEIEL